MPHGAPAKIPTPFNDLTLTIRVMPPAAEQEMLSCSGPWCADFPLAAGVELSKNSRRGIASKNPAPHPGSAWTNSGTALGIEPVLLENCGGSRLQTWNRYAYVGDQPLAYIDPSGMNECAPNNADPAATSSCFHGASDTTMSGDFPVTVMNGIVGGLTNWAEFGYSSGFSTYTIDVSLGVFTTMPGNDSMGGGGGGSWWGTFGKTFLNGVLHGVRQPGQSFSGCVAQNASQTTFGLTDKVSAAAVGTVAAVGATVGAFSQIPSPWANSANTIVNVVGQATGQTPNPVSLTLAGTIGGFIARSMGAGFGATRIAIGAASGLSAGAAYGTVALVGGTIGLYVGSAINCR